MTTGVGRSDLDAPTVRVCVGCGERWHSVKHYSDQALDCDQCGLPLLETLTTTVARVAPDSDDSWVPRFG
jgi:hypothetical protein